MLLALEEVVTLNNQNSHQLVRQLVNTSTGFEPMAFALALQYSSQLVGQLANQLVI